MYNGNQTVRDNRGVDLDADCIFGVTRGNDSSDQFSTFERHTFREHVHSHPGNTDHPSGFPKNNDVNNTGDIRFARKLTSSLAYDIYFFLTSSTCHPKIIREQRCDTLMPFHEHGSKDGLLILRQRHLYCHNSPGKLKHLVHTHVYI